MCSVCDMHSLFCLFISCSVEQVPDVCVSSAGLQLLSAASRRLCGMCHYHPAPATIHFRLPALRFADLCVLFSTTQVCRDFSWLELSRVVSGAVCCVRCVQVPGSLLPASLLCSCERQSTFGFDSATGDGRRQNTQRGAHCALVTATRSLSHAYTHSFALKRPQLRITN